MKLLGIRLEYIQNHTPEDNGNIESFHNSIKTVTSDQMSSGTSMKPL